MTFDNPHVRASHVCPLCDGFKPEGLVTCWDCYRSFGLRYGNDIAELRVSKREAQLRCSAE